MLNYSRKFMAVAMLVTATAVLAQAPTASITLNPVTADNNINAAEAEQTVTVTGRVSGANVKVGDTVTLTLNDGTGPTTFSGQVVDLGNGVLGFSINVPGSALSADVDHVIVTSLTSGNIVIASANTSFGADPTLGMTPTAGGAAEPTAGPTAGTTAGSGGGGGGGGGTASPS